MDAPARAGAELTVPQVLHSRGLAHADRSSLLHHGLDRDEENCVCVCAMKMQLHLFKTWHDLCIAIFEM